MKWRDTLSLPRPLSGVRCITSAGNQDWAELLRQREHAAYNRGRKEGESALGQQLIEQRAEMAELQRGVLEALRGAVAKVVHDTETELIQLALAAARKLVASIPVTVELIESVVREALQQVEDTAEIHIQLNPEDLALLRKASAPILSGLPDTGPLRFAGSPQVSRGGCLIRTRFGVIDATRETKLEQLEKSLAP